MADQLVIAGRTFNSRLIVGTGKYRSFKEMRLAHEASGADMVTVAVRPAMSAVPGAIRSTCTRTGMRSARRTQENVGATAGRRLEVLVS